MQHGGPKLQPAIAAKTSRRFAQLMFLRTRVTWAGAHVAKNA